MQRRIIQLRLLLVGVSILVWAGALTVAKGQPVSPTAPETGPQGLIAELGCSLCHGDLPVTSSLKERAPDLSGAGLRYRPAWLFEFLQNPTKVRRHLGRARMPDFHLSPAEALSLVSFLETQRSTTGQWPALPTEIQTGLSAPPVQVSPAQFQAVMNSGLICLTCHTLDGKGGTLGVELGNIGYRLRPEWVKEYLVAPARFGVAPATMPPQFFAITDPNRGFQEMMPEAATKIQTVTDYLFSLKADARAGLETKLAEARAAHPEANAELGRQLYQALNCSACHRCQTFPTGRSDAAPMLGREGERVQASWLTAYLKRPTAIRPFGYHPGDGSRMPDFHLTDEEVRQLGSFLGARRDASGAPEAGKPFVPQKLSAFSRNKARTLLKEKLSCLGCHRLGDEGGRIGPDLTRVRDRLQADYVDRMVRDPRGVSPHTIMPRIPMPDRTMALVVNFLLQNEESSSSVEGRYLSPVDHVLLPLPEAALSPESPRSVRDNYLIYCASCHGESGQGNGYNAAYLPVAPTRHADADFMAKRPDDTLFDGIHAGGYILNKSQRMPPWGLSLSAEEIKQLVAYLRTLCQCQGPAWSRD